MMKMDDDSEVNQDEGEVLPSIRDLDQYLKTVHDWMTKSCNFRKPQFSEIHGKTCEAWKALGKLFTHNFDVMKIHTLELIPVVILMLQRIKQMEEVSANSSSKPRNDELTANHVFIAGLNCLQVALVALNDDLEKGAPDDEFYHKFDLTWSTLLNEMLRNVLKFEAHAACAMLDLIGAMGSEVFGRMIEGEQRQVIVCLLGWANSKDLGFTATTRAKVGRCLGKMIEFPNLRDDLTFCMDLFGLISSHITEAENVVKISYAWAFANFTDALITNHMNPDLETFSRGFLFELMETALKSIQIHPRGRYSSCRACGNIYKWLTAEMLEDSRIKIAVQQMTEGLISMIGIGIEYKLRWNAAHAVGHALENEIFFLQLKSEVTDPIIKTLAKWTAQSQNYKERIQCVVSLAKAKHRNIYGSMFTMVWERAVLSLTRLPVEDSENSEKFKVDVILLIFHMMSLIQLQDLDPMAGIIARNEEFLKFIVSEIGPSIPMERLDDALKAKESINTMFKKQEDPSRARTLSSICNIMNRVWTEDDSFNKKSK